MTFTRQECEAGMNDTRNIVIAGIEFPGPDGKQYETTGEYRPPKKGEWRLSCYAPTQSTHNWETPEIILRELPPPAPPRRVPTDKDAAVWPRRKCWCLNKPLNGTNGETGKLLHVDESRTSSPFCVQLDNGCIVFPRYCEIEDVPLGPVYHWRDATRNDLQQQFLVVNRGEKYWANTYLTRFFLDDIENGLRVLVEVGK
jgi:hypothetical protein